MKPESAAPEPDPLNPQIIRKAYSKPIVESYKVFEASLACVKIPGSIMCNYNIRRSKS